MFAKNSHCSFCGAAFDLAAPWPRTCATCDNTSFLNPLPVAVMVVPIAGGVLTVRRNIEPARGKLALPGGYINQGETWQAAGVREVKEETGLTIPPDEVQLLAIHSARHDTLLIFGATAPRTPQDLHTFTPNEETSELVIVREPQELAFHYHTQMLKEFLNAHERRK
jgi:ADP-ribose pyrophosphatase YjhB (NUDIX family)